MNKFIALHEYFISKYPEINFDTRSYQTGLYSTQLFEIPKNLLAEAEAFFTAWDFGYSQGSIDTLTRASEEYRKNIQEIVLKVSGASYNEGFAAGADDGFGRGVEEEMNDSVIPSDAYDIEVFAVKPSHEFESGQQAFIGYKFDLNGQPQFHFVQMQFAATNPNKKQIS
jgi:hypothetical protein